jgi:hypothetical protein
MPNGGEILDEPQTGERVRCIAILVDEVAKKPTGTFRLLSTTTVTHSPTSLVACSEELSQAYRFDHVYSPADAGTSLLASLVPLALHCAAGTDASICTLTSPSIVTTTNSLFDRCANKCGAVRILEELVSECRKRSQHCYLSVGLLDPKDDGAVDLLASKPEQLFPVRVPFTPSIRDRNPFPQLQMQNLMLVKKPLDTVQQALRALAALEEHATVSRRSDVFAVATVESRVAVGGAGGEYTTRTSRLVLCDVGNWRRCSELRLSDEAATSPFLGGDSALRLLLYGVGLRSHCAVLAALPCAGGSEDQSFASKLDAIRRVVTFPSKLAPSSSTALFLCPEDEALWLATSEEMAAKRQLNSRVSNETLAARCEQLGEDFETARQALRNMRTLLEDKLPLVVDTSVADRGSHLVLEAKLSVLREVEQEQLQRQQRLDAQAALLMQLPVIDDGRGRPGALPLESRMRLVEDVLVLQQEENVRLRRMFERDVQLLQIELDSSRAVRASKLPHAPLMNALDIFLEEAQLVLGSNTKHSMAKFDALVDRLAAELREQATVILDGRLSTKIPTVDYTRMLVEAAVGKLRRSLGIERPSDSEDDTLRPSGILSWEALAMHSFATRVERDRIRTAAAVMAQQAMRTVACLKGVADDLAAADLPQQQASILLRMERCRLVCEALTTLAQGQTDVLACRGAGGAPVEASAMASSIAALHFTDGSAAPPPISPQNKAADPHLGLSFTSSGSGEEHRAAAAGAALGVTRTVHISLQDALKFVRVDPNDPYARDQKIGKVQRGHFSQPTVPGIRKLLPGPSDSSSLRVSTTKSPSSKRVAR